MKKLQLALSLLSTLIILSCAIIQPIGGGPKDQQPPQLEYSSPLPNSKNVTTKKFVFRFDEYIQLNNFSKEVKVNPYYPTNEIKTQVVGKKLILQFTDTLRENTTYNINFGKAIKDVNEKTPNDNFNFTFSTGQTIDTLAYQGVLINNKTHLPVSGATVTLHTNDNYNPSEEFAIYYATSNKEGTYKFNNIAAGSYKVYSFTDKNNNNLYDSKTEQVGFLSQNINPTNEIIDTCYLFKEVIDPFKMKAPLFGSNYMEINFNRGIKQINNLSIEKYNLTNKYKTLRLYPKDKAINLELNISDSLGQIIDTTLSINYRPKPIKDSSITLKFNIDKNPRAIDQNLSITSSYLIEYIDTSKIYAIKAQDTISINETSIKIESDKNGNKITFISDNQIDTINIYLKEAAIHFASGHINSTISKSYVPIKKKKFGKLSGTINTKEDHYIMYLLDQKNNIILKETNPKEFNYPFVTPGLYGIKILIDKNNDGIYTTGTLSEQPEQYIYYNKPINVKSNWEIGNIHIKF